VPGRGETERSYSKVMSGFDVTRADKNRARGLVALASLSVSAALAIALWTSRDAAVQADSFIAETDITEPEFAALAPVPPSSVRDLVQRATAPSNYVEPSRLYAEPFIFAPRTDPIAFDADAFAECDSCAPVALIERSVPRGGTLAGVLDDAGVDRVEAARAIAALGDVFNLRQLRVGEEISIYLENTDTGNASLRGLSFRPDIERSITVARTYDNGYRARETTAEFRSEMVRATGSITTSLYVDALNSGATDRVVVELATVLGYAIDFQRSIHPGDEFDILFERFVDEEGDTARTGDILYARYDGRGEPMDFFRFQTDDGLVGYYSAEGESAQRLLMLTPINGARLSSHFSRARRHPILGYTRRHNGTDFAAPRGTPIMAAGNGVVERANRFGSFGNYIRIRHANGFQTAYAHLNGFARGIRSGTRVTQGQIIGYVGTTGRSTGPHLHYEVHLNGNPVNPMTLDLPTGRQLDDDEMPAFFAERDRIIAVRDAAASVASSNRPVLAEAGEGGAQ